jgi:hypothetical protein
MDGLGEQIRAKIDEAPPRNRQGGIVLFFPFVCLRRVSSRMEEMELGISQEFPVPVPRVPSLSSDPVQGGSTRLVQFWLNTLNHPVILRYL